MEMPGSLDAWVEMETGCPRPGEFMTDGVTYLH
jgi:hypothetical protein